MSNTYTFTKALTNLIPLISQIKESSFGPRLSYYSYEIGVLTLTFDRALSSIENGILVATVNSYLDKNVLVQQDVTLLKYFRALKTSEQALPTTVGGTTEILWNSLQYKDERYFKIGANSKYITIIKPGTYFIMCKVTAYCATTFVNNTSLQWSLMYDDVKTETFYFTIPGTATYTTHTNANLCADGTNICCAFTVNSITGTNVKLQCKLQSGTTPLYVNGDSTSITILSLPGVSMYEANTTVTSMINTTTNTNITLGAPRLSHYPLSSVTGQANVTVSQPGYLLVFGKATFNKTTGTDVTVGTVKILQNGILSSVGMAYTPPIIAASLKTSTHVSGLLFVNAGDVISMQAILAQGSSTQVVASETGMVLLYLSNASLSSMTIGNFINSNLIGSTMSTTPADVIFSFNNVSGYSEISSDGQSHQITDSGYCLLVAESTFYNPSGIQRWVQTRFIYSIDKGITYNIVPCSCMYKQLIGTGKTTLLNHVIVNLPPGTLIKIQGSTNGVKTDNIQIGDNSNLSIINFENLNTPNPHVFTPLYEFAYQTSPEAYSLINTSFVEKGRLVTQYLSAGVYRIGSATNLQLGVGITSVNFGMQMVVVQNNVSTIIFTKHKLTNSTEDFHTVNYVYLNEGVNTIFLQYLTLDGSAAVISDVIIELWRIK